MLFLGLHESIQCLKKTQADAEGAFILLKLECSACGRNLKEVKCQVSRDSMYHRPLGLLQPVEGCIWGSGWRIRDMHSNWGSLLRLCSIFCSTIWRPIDSAQVYNKGNWLVLHQEHRKHENMSEKFNHPLDLASKQSSVAIHAHLKEKASKGAFQENCLVTWTLDLWVYKKRKD